ncbi:MAG: hypothetical protein PHT07_21670 [Paludibacter sp.]|nr:hypothetical protein [Paludibacter sp.]
MNFQNITSETGVAPADKLIRASLLVLCLYNELRDYDKAVAFVYMPDGKVLKSLRIQ